VILTASALTVIVTGIAIHGLVTRKPATQTMTESSAIARIGPMERQVLSARPEIERIVRSFHKAKTPEEKAGYIRAGKILLPTLRRYYARHPPEIEVSEFLYDSFNWVQVAGCTVVYGLLAAVDGTTHQFTVELAPEGCRLDWQALTGWKGTEWSNFLESRSDRPVTMCVSASPDTLFTGPFADAGKWICLRIEDVTGSHVAWAYVRRDSKAAEALPPGFRETPSPESSLYPQEARRLTVELRFPSEARHAVVPLVEVTALHHHGWFDPTLTDSRP
jgi:hypothetical protein